MGTTVHGRRLLIVSAGLVPLSNKAWEGVEHRQYVITSGNNEPITVYDIDITLITPFELYRNWIADSDYRLPVGKGLKKLLEVD